MSMRLRRFFLLFKTHTAIFIIGVLFFVFGFVSWLNAILIPYFRLICTLTLQQGMLVVMAFYISYFIMGLPASYILKKTGFKTGMMLGLLIMAAGTLLFMPAAACRAYPLFLTGLFVQATGLTLLQTASNPYVTILGPADSAARRISIMGVCNKVAGAIAPLLLMQVITTHPDEIDQLQKTLPSLPYDQKITVLNGLSHRLILPYAIISAVLIGLGCLVRFSALPELKENTTREGGNTGSGNSVTRESIFQYPHLLLGALAIFCAVSVEVLAVDSIISYGQFQGMSFRASKFFATYTLLIMIVSYSAGILAIPKYISQRKVLQLSACSGLFFALLSVVCKGSVSVWCVALLGLGNALLWPAIWPLALHAVGMYTKKGSALLIMGIIGGAIAPLLYGWVSKMSNQQTGYVILFPYYIFLLYYALAGYRLKTKRAHRNN
jgi:FHS family L-fucose permease-like MFS transporter